MFLKIQKIIIAFYGFNTKKLTVFYTKFTPPSGFLYEVYTT